MSNDSCDLVGQSCKPCEGGVPSLSLQASQDLLKRLHADWRLIQEGAALRREFKFKGFAKTVYFVNLLAWLADKEGHHPDVEFGYGYCNVIFSTHAIKGLSENDFICAAKVDALLMS